MGASVIFRFILFFLLLGYISLECFPGCSCVTDHYGRSLTCMETALSAIPEEIPGDLTKIRIEKSQLSELPKSAFSRVKSLKNLWLNFNDIAIINIKSLEGLGNLTELRLQGNKLRSVPWTAFEETPNLKILDLKHNRIDALPEYALKFLPGLTYLDLSSNQLSVISKDVFLNWPLYQTEKKSEKAATTNVVLALHDNPWLCDCRLGGFVEFVETLSPPFILMNSYLTCSGPEFRAGKYFHEVDLKACVKPVVSAPATNITVPLGGNVTLTCFVTARPEPAIRWIYGLKILRGFREIQSRVDEDTIRSQLVIPSFHPADRGLYTCNANNFIGNSSINIQLDVNSPDGSMSLSLGLPADTAEENIYIDIRIAKQTIYGITIEWHAVAENPAETWFTIHFGRYDMPKKETIYIGPGINTYSITDLQPATKYEICVTLKNQAPRNGQCIVFVTGSDFNEMEEREKLIHIVVIVLAMVLAVPAGMYACTTDTKFNCLECCMEMWRNRRDTEHSHMPDERQGTFDSLQAASDEGLCKESSKEKKARRRSADKIQKTKNDCRTTAELY
ncbi:leucine-rich repeat, immunoglobulin-like domain and transmembrane domain-containing protein 2 [Myxocyprinus asiaticus]|uniref:leucine-rich repeat, immunoglobulin-like domain and transmembrane domain-containing protein 2 n=1 Tax=Myxocyprinus asiaticus TaxID=70543 RepID=UPI002222745D|nr:leucine-rich repeat, immunoglobulin-like domain and transmembrane domain-containing protein 2 [Myxocyprinus asiaticus]